MAVTVTYRALRDGGACASGIRDHLGTLRRAGVAIPRRYSEAEVPLLVVLDHLGVQVTLEAAAYARLDAPFLRLFAADCAERALLREREAGREPDPRSWAAVEVARRYARGEATREELDAARAAALAAEAAGSAGSAAWAASAAVDASGAVSWAAASATAAWAAAADRDAERAWQAERLHHYLLAEAP